MKSGLKKGSVSESCYKNVSLVDIFPTLTELCGIPQKEGISGRSLIPLLENPELDWSYPAITSLTDRHFSIRINELHYINYNGLEEELYNLNSDPEEWNNLAMLPEYSTKKDSLNSFIPQLRHELVKTDPIRWADVLSGKVQFYK